MALKDLIPFGMSLPHRSPDSVGVDVVHAVATGADTIGFRDLWVTENTLDHVMSFDPIVVLTYAAAVTSRIGLGASVLVLPVHDPRMVAHQWASLDALSNGRAIMGVGIGRPFHFTEFEVPQEGRVARFREQIELIRALWSHGKVTHHGRYYNLDDAKLGVRPVQQPLPVWMGVGHPDAIRRAAGLADGWMGAGGSSTEDFRKAVPLLKESLEKGGRDRQNSRSPNGSSWRSTTTRRLRVPNCIVGIPRCIITRPALMPQAFTAHRNMCGNGWRRWSTWVRTTFY